MYRGDTTNYDLSRTYVEGRCFGQRADLAACFAQDLANREGRPVSITEQPRIPHFGVVVLHTCLPNNSED